MGITVIVKGSLRGMGCEAECSLMATRIESNREVGGTYTKCAVLNAPGWLPDGYYEAVFCGQSAFLHRMDGVWSVGIPWRQHAERKLTTFEQEAGGAQASSL